MGYPNDRFRPKPVLLLVLDGIRPDVLRDAVEEGEAPALGALAQAGEAVWDGVSVFPSITPAATAAIATGCPPAQSGILGHAWYDRREGRLIVYGAMTETVIRSGPIKVFHNNVYRLNRDDLLVPTIFERLHERGIDGSCVNFPIRRGPHEHPVRSKVIDGYASRGGRYLGQAVRGPKEYYLGDLFYTRQTKANGRRGSGGLLRSVGINDEYASEVGAMLIRERATPFTLLYFFRGDKIAHHKGLAAQRRYVAQLDGYVGRVFEAGGGLERLLDEYAILALSDHGHDPLLPESRYVDLRWIPGYRVSIGTRARLTPRRDVVAVPGGRSAMLYLREGIPAEQVADALMGRRGVDLAAWMEDGWVRVRKPGGDLRFRPGGGLLDPYGGCWRLEGEPGVLDIEVGEVAISYGDYPDALERLWGALRSPRCGDVVLSAAPGYTFGEVARSFHDASDHGSLHASDSSVFVLASGISAPRRITEVVPVVLSHFEGHRERYAV